MPGRPMRVSRAAAPLDLSLPGIRREEQPGWMVPNAWPDYFSSPLKGGPILEYLSVLGEPLPDGCGSVTFALISQGLPSRDRQGAVPFSRKSPKPAKRAILAALRRPPRLLHHSQLNPRPVRAAEIHAFERLPEIVRWRLGNLDKLLRIAVRQRKPGTLHLHHDPVPRPPGMRDVRQIERNPVRLVGIKRHGLFETLAELTAERLTANQFLVSAHRRRVHRSRPRSSRPRGDRRRWIVIVRIVAREHVDYFHIKIGIRPGRGHLQVHLNGSEHRHVMVQRFGLEYQHIGTRGGEPLILGHIRIEYALRDMA